jgi:hypothetical protein
MMGSTFPGGIHLKISAVKIKKPQTHTSLRFLDVGIGRKGLEPLTR